MKKISIELSRKAQKMGVAAFRAGAEMAPALNKEFAKFALASGNFVEMCKAYANGWTYANLANGAICAGLYDLPCIKKLAEIDSWED